MRVDITFKTDYPNSAKIDEALEYASRGETDKIASLGNELYLVGTTAVRKTNGQPPLIFFDVTFFGDHAGPAFATKGVLEKILSGLNITLENVTPEF